MKKITQDDEEYSKVICSMLMLYGRTKMSSYRGSRFVNKFLCLRSTLYNTKLWVRRRQYSGSRKASTLKSKALPLLARHDHCDYLLDFTRQCENSRDLTIKIFYGLELREFHGQGPGSDAKTEAARLCKPHAILLTDFIPLLGLYSKIL